jgi:hypothetical protein
MLVTLRNGNGDTLWTGTGVADIEAIDEQSAPVLMAIEPAVKVLGTADDVLHCYGSGFAAGAVIIWNGTAEPTTRVSSRELTTGINMATASTPLTLSVAVRNPDGGESVALAFRFDPVTP